MNDQALKARLQAIANETNLRFVDCWKHLLLERFLARLALSKFNQACIFKGGFLLQYIMPIGRVTTDLDFLLVNQDADLAKIHKLADQICATPMTDGFVLSIDDVKLLQQPHMSYPGYRIRIAARFGVMKDTIQVDLGVGDKVDPVWRHLHLTEYRNVPVFEGDISLLTYTLETIFAEKLETALSKGAGNSRMKDYHDLLLLARKEQVLNKATLKNTILQTFQQRGTAYCPLVFSTSELAIMNKYWTAHLNNLGPYKVSLNLPSDITQVIQEINQLLEKI